MVTINIEEITSICNQRNYKLMIVKMNLSWYRNLPTFDYVYFLFTNQIDSYIVYLPNSLIRSFCIVFELPLDSSYNYKSLVILPTGLPSRFWVRVTTITWANSLNSFLPFFLTFPFPLTQLPPFLPFSSFTLSHMHCTCTHKLWVCVFFRTLNQTGETND